MDVNGVYGIYPRRKQISMVLPKKIERPVAVGEYVQDEELSAVLDGVFHQGDNAYNGLFVVSEWQQVCVYQRDNGTFKRVL